MEVAIEDYDTVDSHIKPTLEFETEITLDQKNTRSGTTGLAPVMITGRIETREGVVITSLEEYKTRSGLPHTWYSLKAFNEHDKFEKNTFTTWLRGTLDHDAVDYLDEIRERDEFDDVNIKVIVQVRSIANKLNISHTRGENNNDMDLNENEEVLIYDEDMEVDGRKSDQYLVSTGRDLMPIGMLEEINSDNVRIPSSRWTKSIYPGLSGGERLSIEMMKPDQYNDVSIADDLEEATNSLKQAQGHIQKGEWERAVSDLFNGWEAVTANDDLWEVQGTNYGSCRKVL